MMMIIACDDVRFECSDNSLWISDQSSESILLPCACLLLKVSLISSLIFFVCEYWRLELFPHSLRSICYISRCQSRQIIEWVREWERNTLKADTGQVIKVFNYSPMHRTLIAKNIPHSSSMKHEMLLRGGEK